MRIAINGYRLLGHRAGQGVYLSGILRAWESARISDSLEVICPGTGDDAQGYAWDHCQIVGTGRSQKLIIWENVVLPRFARRADVLFCPSFFAPIKCCVPLVTTVHDVIHEVYPRSVPVYWRWRLRLGIRWALRKAAAVITISECSQKDICKYYDVDPSKIYVTYLGVAPLFREVDKEYARRVVLRRYNIGRPYILYVGSILRRRNVDRLIRAFSLAYEQLVGYDLVIAGKNYQRLDFLRVGGGLMSGGRIKYIGCPTDEELLLLYNAAVIVIYPSSYEGFGIPVVEAMACGVPVIAGDNSAMLEIARGAVLLVDVSSTEAINNGILSLVNNEGYRRGLIELGLQRARCFSWDKTGMDTLEIIRRVGRAK